MGAVDTPLVNYSSDRAIYSSDLLWSLCGPTHHVLRPVRKALFAAGLWRPFTGQWECCRPILQRSPSQDIPEPPPNPVKAPSHSDSSCSSSSRSGLRVATWNAHSIRKKYIAVAEAITSHDLDLLAVTESWHQTPADVSVLRSIPPNYSILDRPRGASTDGGGIIVAVCASNPSFLPLLRQRLRLSAHQ